MTRQSGGPFCLFSIHWACTACADSETFCAALVVEGFTGTRVDTTLAAIDSLDPVACPTTTP